MIGDELIGIDSMKFTYYDEFQKYLAENKEQSDRILTYFETVKMLNIPVTPTCDRDTGCNQQTDPSIRYFELKTIKYGFFQSIPAGISKGIQDNW